MFKKFEKSNNIIDDYVTSNVGNSGYQNRNQNHNLFYTANDLQINRNFENTYKKRKKASCK